MPPHQPPPRTPAADRRRPAQQVRYEGPERRYSWRAHSGYGMDSIRRQLRAQLEMHSLLRPGFPPPESQPYFTEDTRSCQRPAQKNPPGGHPLRGYLGRIQKPSRA